MHEISGSHRSGPSMRIQDASDKTEPEPLPRNDSATLAHTNRVSTLATVADLCSRNAVLLGT
jgi:hypothetical protein